MSILWTSPRISSLVLLLLGLSRVGVSLGGAHPRRPAPSNVALQPIGQQDTRSICTALCIAGLGGEPCGAACATLTPRNATANSDADAPQSDGGGAADDTPGVGLQARTRRDACPLLCKYALGEPLCGCSVDDDDDSRRRLKTSHVVDVNFHRICDYFCAEHDYHIYGCPACSLYRMQYLDRRVRPTEMEIDWTEWCKQQCANGTGGVACACDPALPLMAAIANNTDT